MKGKHKIIVQNNRLHYEFEIKRNITVIQGDSATGKTTLINMLRQAENLGISSGIDVACDVPCRVLEGPNWELILKASSGTIFFTDEENTFINTEEFASAIRNSDNYFVLITRENLYNLPYSVEEIGSVKNFVALVKNGSFLVRITDMTILIEKEFIYGSSKRPNPTDYYRKQHYQCG